MLHVLPSLQHRRDLRLSMEPEIELLVRMVVNRYRSVYERLLTPHAELVELGVMTSHPGSKQQIIHSDVTYVADAQEIYTTFVALQVNSPPPPPPPSPT